MRLIRKNKHLQNQVAGFSFHSMTIKSEGEAHKVNSQVQSLREISTRDQMLSNLNYCC